MEGRYLTVTVKPYIKKFLIESMDSEIIKTERGSTLLAIIKPHLILKTDVDEVEEEKPKVYEEIQIELPDLRQVYNTRSGKTYYCDTMFRDQIDPVGMAKVRYFLNRTCKASFRTFMDGYTEFQNETKGEEDRIRVKMGVCAFFNQYHITCDEKMISCFTRDWYRHRERNEKNRFSPVLY